MKLRLIVSGRTRWVFRICDADARPGVSGPGFRLVATAEAIVGRPITPVSYAGVARRTAVRRY